mmetsp:Transcript_4897/g.7445  ORF Transcript_4897/g.7445 Transcript_4897/m.7445 type:complete len:102 (+) Transcript_4897:1052-1357(+)
MRPNNCFLASWRFISSSPMLIDAETGAGAVISSTKESSVMVLLSPAVVEYNEAKLAWFLLMMLFSLAGTNALQEVIPSESSKLDELSFIVKLAFIVSGKRW